VAPRLQEIGINPSLFSRSADLDLNNLTSVRHLGHLRLNMFTMVTPAYSLISGPLQMQVALGTSSALSMMLVL
jgi:hypothetical protein